MKPNDLKKKIERYYHLSEETSGIFDLGNEKVKDAYINEILKNSIGDEICKIIKKQYPNPRGLKLLDMGCGLGGLVVASEKGGIRAFGIDIDKNAIAIAKKRVKDPENILVASGEKLPFKKNTFDIVTSTCTIEHVKKSQKYLSEALRVLKNKGLFIIYAPNYLFPWEGHYKMLWLPYIFPYTKSVFKLYLIIGGKKTDFIKAINFKITPGYLKKLLKQVGFKDIQNIGVERFLKKIKNPSKIANPGLGEIIVKFKKNKILNLFLKIFISSLKITKLYYPIIFTAKAFKKYD
jgi:ubiquinone/menaquinone biosynthesis C-methylase UbiE